MVSNNDHVNLKGNYIKLLLISFESTTVQMEESLVLKEERHRHILGEIASHSPIYVSHLAQHLAVSEATVRKDLNMLEQSGLIKRIHGGAVAIPSTAYDEEIDFVTRAHTQQSEKQAIAKMALTHIHDHDSLFLDASSTCYELANLLRQTKLQLTVITNGINTASLLEENKLIRTYVLGGLLRSKNSIGGLLGIGIFTKIHVNKAFMSARGIDFQHGLTDFNIEEVELKNYVVGQASEIIALLDSTKIGTVSVLSFCPIEKISLLVTDSNSSRDFMHRLADQGIAIQTIHVPQQDQF